MTTVGEVMTANPLSVSSTTPATHVRSLFREEGYRNIPVTDEGRLVGIINRGDILKLSSTKSNLLAQGIMEQAPVIATPDMEILDLTRKLLNANEIQAPVVESGDNLNLNGIISAADILNHLLNQGFHPQKSTVSEAYQSNVVTCDYQDSLSQVWVMMDENGYSGIPVTKKSKLIAMITRKDIIDSGNIRLNLESAENPRSIKVEKVMKTPPVVVTKDTPLTEAAQLLLKYDIGRLPVVQNPIFIKKEPQRAKIADIIGIISREDILWSYI